MTMFPKYSQYTWCFLLRCKFWIIGHSDHLLVCLGTRENVKDWTSYWVALMTMNQGFWRNSTPSMDSSRRPTKGTLSDELLLWDILFGRLAHGVGGVRARETTKKVGKNEKITIADNFIPLTNLAHHASLITLSTVPSLALISSGSVQCGERPFSKLEEYCPQYSIVRYRAYTTTHDMICLQTVMANKNRASLTSINKYEKL